MNPRRVAAVSRKEYIHLFRDARSLLVIILVPALLLILFGYALKLDVERVEAAFIDHDKSVESGEYLAGFKAGGLFGFNYFPSGYEEAENLLNRGKIKVFIVVPRGFARDIATLGTSGVQVIADGSEVTAASAILNYIEGINAFFNASVAEKAAASTAGASVPGLAETRTRFWFNEEMRSVNYLFPGLVAIIISVVAGFLTSLTIAGEWENGSMEQLIPTPLTSAELITGKLITYFTIGAADMIIYAAVGEWIFHVPLKGGVAPVFIFGALFLLGTLAFGVWISALMKSPLAAGQVTTAATMLPSFLLSGFVFDIANMPPVIRAITYLFPARYYVDILRGVYLKGVGFGYIWANGLFIAIYAALMLFLCSSALKMRSD